jgi:hypothetical protein
MLTTWPLRSAQISLSKMMKYFSREKETGISNMRIGLVYF